MTKTKKVKKFVGKIEYHFTGAEVETRVLGINRGATQEQLDDLDTQLDRIFKVPK